MHTDLQEVADGRVRMLAHKATLNHEIVDMLSNEIVIETAKSGKVKDALMGTLTAERVVVTSQGVAVHPETGELITEPDHTMRLEGVKTWGGLIKNVRATGAAVQVSAQFNNSNTQNNVISGGRSFEARMREAERKYKEENGKGSVIDAEEVEEEETDEEEGVDKTLDDPDAVDEDEDDDEE